MTNSNYFTADFFQKNREKVQKDIPQNSIAFVFSSDELPRNGDQNFRFRQNSNLFYLTGIEQEDTILCINPSHHDNSKKEILFIKRSSELIEIWEGHKFTIEEAENISGIKNIKYFDQFFDLISDLMYYAENVYISTNENLKYKRFYNDADYRFIERLKFQFPLHNYKRLSPIITKNRLIKQPQEIETIQKAINITEKAFRRVLKFIKPGVFENEIEAEITHEFIRNNCYNHSYLPIVASGKNNCILHYINNNKKCNSGELVLMDFGAEYMNYAADLSRTIPVNGKFDEMQKLVYKAVLKVQKEATKLLTIGKTISKWNTEVGKIMENELLELQLITSDEISNQKLTNPIYKKYFMHGTGHFLGLDVHDVGTNDTLICENMILTNEPGIYIKEMGFGIRLENDILISQKGNIDLMKNTPIEIEEIEDLMN